MKKYFLYSIIVFKFAFSIIQMTGTQIYEHILGVLLNHPDHTIVRHKKTGGGLCYRIRDSAVNPVANFTDAIFQSLQDNNLLTKINEREWQLNIENLKRR